ncbi:saccharopine dehydrogenase NADP-binding domain-containing protein [Sporomusa termitida]|uniref:Saccharopine dehydrogenase NADP binding domain protein n=1 Tax=Sporomusa termitida TaxID=2377 RepID=A0A517DRG1_9FIRM|nr:saccharopine dehydrogenase NADP-binding domain-containing protein [Sporomusa termitida]QDR79898.1 Saccharopine dehydrogenase NADP binding domain protein [Sporomusa termitida]
MIGVIGGYGDVGLQAVRMLQKWGKVRLKIGGRNPAEARKNLGVEFAETEWVPVDAENVQSVEHFLAGCELVINCTGPSSRLGGRVAGMCLAKGCHHIDAGVNKELESLHGAPYNTISLYAAGAVPGLSGLLPRWLAKSFDQLESMLCYIGSLDRFTASAAEDYLAGASGRGNKPLAAWQNGSCRLSVLRRRERIQLPFFAREVTLYPYFDQEAEFVASSLLLNNGEWYIASDGKQVSSLLEEVCGQFLTERETAIRRLCRASEIDSAGRQRYINFIIQLSGKINGCRIDRTLVLQADRPAVLTGLAAAAAGMAVLAGEIPPGVCPLAEIVDPCSVVTRLVNANGIKQLKVFEGPIEQLLQQVEGEI